jgi:PAS domain S-box-containing protein
MASAGDYFDALLGDTGGFLAALDERGVCRHVAPEVREVLGYDPEEMLGRSCFEFVALADPAAGPRAIARLLASRGRLERRVLPVRHRDGGYLMMEILLRDLRRRVDIGAILVHARDVTGERQVATKLAESRTELAEAYQFAGLGRVAWDAQTGEVALSAQLLELLQWKRQPSARWQDLRHMFVHPEDLGRVELAWASAELGETVRFECRVVRPDGSLRHWLMQAQGVLGTVGGQGRVTGTVMDVTELRQAEEELFRAQKLEALDQLAAGIAHDFNNLLTVIRGNLSLARQSVAEQADVEPLLAEATAACDRAAYLAHQLSKHVRSSEAQAFSPTRLGPLLADVIPFLLRGSRVKSEILAPDDLEEVRGDAGELAQVLQNLVMNAVAAMPDGGVLRAQAESVALPDADPTVPVPPGPYVRLLVADSGHGVAPEHLPRIFDPYFTTRQGGQGLGLATTRRIVRHHEGHIAVQSRTGQGTIFTIYLPAARAEAPVAAAAEAPSPTELRRELRVLLVDDDAPVRRAGAGMLRELGCRAEVAAGSVEALSLMRRSVTRGRPYEVAILDVTMPGDLGARELFEQLWAIHPMLRGLVSSGYTSHDAMLEPARYGFRAALPKPYDIAAMREALVAAIDGERKPGPR